ncbi:MAG: dienelactone hydrolase family protein [Spirochaetes bacterium]|nr:dienelactone hydrolase family protein [Spirochaetota bacterium]
MTHTGTNKPVRCLIGLAITLTLCGISARMASAAQGSQGRITFVTNGTFNRTAVPYGYLEYLPTNYDSLPAARFRLMIFLHGIGERGSGSSNELIWLQRIGLPKLLRDGKDLPAIVLMLQCPTNQLWSADYIYKMFIHATNEYRVDYDRIVLTGLSMGGMGSWDFTQHYPGILAACVPICGPAGMQHTSIAINLAATPIWTFHATNDTAAPAADTPRWIDAMRNMQYEPNPPGCVTGYPAGTWATGHDNNGSWTWLAGTNYVTDTKILYTRIPVNSHYIWDYVYNNSYVYEWMFSRTNPARIMLTNAHMTPDIGTNGTTVTFGAFAHGFATAVTGMTIDLTSVGGGVRTMTIGSGAEYTNAFALPAAVTSGMKKISVIATEGAGRSRTNTLWVMVTNTGIQPPTVSGAPSSLTTNKPFTVTLDVDRNFGYWSTNSASGPYQQFTTAGTAISFSRTETLWYFGASNGISGITNSVTYTFDTAAPAVTGAPNSFTTNRSFTVSLDVNENYGYWSTNGSAYMSFTTTGTNIIIDRTAVLSVYGRDMLGNSSATNTYTYTLVIAPPAAPSGLAIQDLGTMTLKLSWTDNAANESAFRIYRSTNGTSFAYLMSAGANSTSFTDSPLSAGVTYWYRISATNSGGESALTAAVSQQPMVHLSVSNISAEPRTDTRTLKLSYMMIKNCTNAATISLEYRTANSGVWVAIPAADIIGTGTLNTSGSFTNEWNYPSSLNMSERYDIRVTARVGASSVTDVLSGVSLSAPAKNLANAAVLNNPCRPGSDAIIVRVPGNVTATIYSVSGRRITMLNPTDADRSAGRVSWNLTGTNGKKVSPGVYLCHLVANAETTVVKIMVQP